MNPDLPEKENQRNAEPSDSNEIIRLKRKIDLLESRLRNSQQVFSDFNSIAESVGYLIDSSGGVEAVSEALEVIGEGTSIDRIHVLKNEAGLDDESEIITKQFNFWVREGDIGQVKYQSYPYDVFFPNWKIAFEKGQCVYGSYENVSGVEQLTLSKHRVKSYLWVPLFHKEKWWGVMGFEQVTHSRSWHVKEISGFELLAKSVMGSVNRKRLQKDLDVFQERYEMASEAGQVGVWDWNLEKNEVYLDPSIKTMAGYSNDELPNDLVSWEQLVELDSKINWIEELNTHLLKKETDFEVEHWIRHKDGTLLGGYSRGKAFYDESGRPRRILGTTSNINHLSEIQKDLRDAKEQAEQGSRAKSEFMASISHEIRTPLNSVIGFATLLNHTELDPEQYSYLSNLQISSKLLLSLVNNILDFAKIEAGKLELENKPFDIRTSVHTIIQVFGDMVIHKGIKLEDSHDDAVPARIFSDPIRVQQVILNLVSNAVKFTETGGIEISTYWKSESESKGRLCIAVADTGIGIEEDRMRAVFEPFTQADSTMTRRFGGTGLGLAISQKILQSMGSSLQLQSEVGTGSVFSFELEVDVAELETAPELKKSSNQVTQTPVVSASKTVLNGRAKSKILLAEDNEMNQKVISKLLQKLGYDAVIVEDGRQAVEAVKRWNFDLVLMDLMMPVQDGISATYEIRGTLPKDKQPKIVAITANSSVDDKDNCKDAGMDDFISKPVDIETLEEKLKLHLGMPDIGEVELESVAFKRIPSGTSDDEPVFRGEEDFKHFDPSYMKNLIGFFDDLDTQNEFVYETIEVFLDTTEELVLSLGEFVEAKLWDDLERCAHSLKGCGKTVGALELANKALQIELWVKEGHKHNRNQEIIDIIKEYNSLSKELAAYHSMIGKVMNQPS